MAVHTTAQSFSLAIAKHAKAIPNERMQLVTRAMGMEALRRLMFATRVDTGRLRGNWQVGEIRPPSGEIDRLDKTGATVTAEEGPKIEGATGQNVLWFHNGLKYAAVWEREDKMVVGTAEALRIWLSSMRGRL